MKMSLNRLLPLIILLIAPATSGWAEETGDAEVADRASVLFVRGADRSGGFLEARDDHGRTEQLSDIRNDSTNRGDHGWATLAATLTESGFKVTQITETVEPDAKESGPTRGVAVPFEEMDLTQYDVIVLASNNAAYDKPAVDAIEKYLRAGGGVLFISDANFGGNWADASNSDQPFLDRLGLTANQDHGTYVLRRDKNEFAKPDHPILKGIDAFDGEGVTPVTVNETQPEGVTVEILVHPKGNVRRNDKPDSRGSTTPATQRDAVLAVGTAGQGRFAWHFDRNTFFNKNGAGTDITRFDNKTYAINLFTWIASD